MCLPYQRMHGCGGEEKRILGSGSGSCTVPLALFDFCEAVSHPAWTLGIFLVSSVKSHREENLQSFLFPDQILVLVSPR